MEDARKGSYIMVLEALEVIALGSLKITSPIVSILIQRVMLTKNARIFWQNQKSLQTETISVIALPADFIVCYR